jgi:hypothetical protein
MIRNFAMPLPQPQRLRLLAAPRVCVEAKDHFRQSLAMPPQTGPAAAGRQRVTGDET